jgi:two-component system response regulator DctR
MDTISVLIVEDNPIIAEIHRELVESVDGFTVVSIAATRKRIVDLLVSKRPNLVIIDNNLPDFSGLEIISFARNSGLPIDFIMATAVNDGTSLTLALRYGVMDYIIKPFSAERFKASLASYRLFFMQITEERILQQEKIDEWYKTKAFFSPADN